MLSIVHVKSAEIVIQLLREKEPDPSAGFVCLCHGLATLRG